MNAVCWALTYPTSGCGPMPAYCISVLLAISAQAPWTSEEPLMCMESISDCAIRRWTCRRTPTCRARARRPRSTSSRPRRRPGAPAATTPRRAGASLTAWAGKSAPTATAAAPGRPASRARLVRGALEGLGFSCTALRLLWRRLRATAGPQLALGGLATAVHAPLHAIDVGGEGPSNGSRRAQGWCAAPRP